MLFSKNYNNAFEFIKVITQNLILFPGHCPNGIFDDVKFTSALHSGMLMLGINFLFFNKVEYQEDSCQKFLKYI